MTCPKLHSTILFRNKHHDIDLTMEFDDDNSCSSGHSDTGSPYNLRRRSASGDEEVTGGRTTGKRVKKK